MAIYLSVERLREICDPFDNPWNFEGAFSVQDVRRAMDGGCLNDVMFAPTAIVQDWSLEAHIARIAYLAVNGWHDPIHIDVGVPELGCHVSHMVTDGNHRLAAAIVMGCEEILTEAQGCVDRISDLAIGAHTGYRDIGPDDQEMDEWEELVEAAPYPKY